MQVEASQMPMNMVSTGLLSVACGSELPMLANRKPYLMLLGLMLSATVLASTASAQPLAPPGIMPIPTGVVTLVMWLVMVGFGLHAGQSWGLSLDRRWGQYPRYSRLLGGIGLVSSAVVGFVILRGL
jgi:hypothetical protein